MVSDDFGWNVYVEAADERVVSMTHCSDWHRVERLCAYIERLGARDAMASHAEHNSLAHDAGAGPLPEPV